MNALDSWRYALSGCVAAALLIGCGGSQRAFVPSNNTQQAVGAAPASRTASFNVLYSFKGGENGHSPIGGVTMVQGLFYGGTSIGGSPKCNGKAYGCGTIFSLTSTGHQSVLYRFAPPGGLNGNGSFVYVHGLLYGETPDGGTPYHCGAGSQGGCGTVFELSTSGKERAIYNFKGIGSAESDGSEPTGGLRYLDGKFFGVTFGGGSLQEGTIFEVDLAGKERILHSFGSSDSDGANPQEGLIDVNGTFYGTTGAGGHDWGACRQAFGNSCGTVFSITPSGKYRVLYRFKGARDAAAPGGLTYLNGRLYGTSVFGGVANSNCPAGCGTVYEIDPNSGSERVIYRFTGGADGDYASAALMSYRGMLYGVTLLGGTGQSLDCSLGGGCGTIFQMTTLGEKTVLHDFAGADGAWPNSRLLRVGGSLYGTSTIGGPHCLPALGCGVVFELTP
jgi:uncharacterized repeat protein (TIGR03803 family)